MISEKAREKSLAALTERLQGFIDDGYWIVFCAADKCSFFMKLCHHNGNRISLSLNLKNGELSQFTNNKQVFTGKVC